MSVPVPTSHGGRIVVGVDGSLPSEQALRWAADQAARTGQELHAVLAWQVATPFDTPVPDEADWGREAVATLRRTLERVLGEPAPPRVATSVPRGHPASVLLEAARDAELLVVGSRGHGGVAGLLLGSVGQHLLARAACPVVVVHERSRRVGGPVVVGVEDSPGSREALRWAAAQARLTGAELRAVTAWHVPGGYGVTVGREADWAAHGEGVLEAAVEAALDAADAARVVRVVVEGRAAAELLRAAEGADLLVVGGRGRGGFPGMRLGSVSRHVAAHAGCPVAVVRGAPQPPGTA